MANSELRMKWLGGIVGGVLVTLITTWLLGFLNQFLLPPKRAWLILRNLCRSDPQRPEDGFRVVLSWLEDDRSGKDTKTVERAFSGVDNIKLVRSARIVEVSGAGEDWREEMRQSVRVVLEDWNANLAVVGLVKTPGEVLSLWFVSRSGEGTLGSGDHPYNLKDMTLGVGFHNDLRAQLTAVALATVKSLAGNEVRGRVLVEELRGAIEQLSILLKGPTIDSPEHRANLHVALGTALQTLGESEHGTERLEEAIKACRAALMERTREHMPPQWAITQNNLGAAFLALSTREPGIKRLVEASNAFIAALRGLNRQRVPLHWAMAWHNLGNVLLTVAEPEPDTERLEEAVKAYRAALEEYAAAESPERHDIVRNNLDRALRKLRERRVDPRME